MLVLDGVDDFVEVADSASLHAASQLTISGWARVDGFPRTWQNIVFKGNVPDDGSGGSANREYALWINAGGYLHFNSTPAARVDVGTRTLTSAAGSVLAGRWFHFAAVIDGDAARMRLYLDGRLVAEGDYDPGGIRDTDGPLRIGHSPPWDSWFGGDIAELAVWQAALSIEQIRDVMYRAADGSEPGLSALWTFAGSGAVVADASGNGNHGARGVSSVQRREPGPPARRSTSTASTTTPRCPTALRCASAKR